MKNIFLILLASVWAVSAQVRVPGTLTNGGNAYPVAPVNLVAGAPQLVPDLATVSNLPAWLRATGQVFHVLATSTDYRLVGGVDNSNLLAVTTITNWQPRVDLLYVNTDTINFHDTSFLLHRLEDDVLVLTNSWNGDGLEIGQLKVTTSRPIYAPEFHGSGAYLTGIAGPTNGITAEQAASIAATNAAAVTNNYLVSWGLFPTNLLGLGGMNVAAGDTNILIFTNGAVATFQLNSNLNLNSVEVDNFTVTSSNFFTGTNVFNVMNVNTFVTSTGHFDHIFLNGTNINNFFSTTTNIHPSDIQGGSAVGDVNYVLGHARTESTNRWLSLGADFQINNGVLSVYGFRQGESNYTAPVTVYTNGVPIGSFNSFLFEDTSSVKWDMTNFNVSTPDLWLRAHVTTNVVTNNQAGVTLSGNTTVSNLTAAGSITMPNSGGLGYSAISTRFVAANENTAYVNRSGPSYGVMQSWYDAGNPQSSFEVPVYFNASTYAVGTNFANAVFITNGLTVLGTISGDGSGLTNVGASGFQPASSVLSNLSLFVQASDAGIIEFTNQTVIGGFSSGVPGKLAIQANLSSNIPSELDMGLDYWRVFGYANGAFTLWNEDMMTNVVAWGPWWMTNYGDVTVTGSLVSSNLTAERVVGTVGVSGNYLLSTSGNTYLNSSGDAIVASGGHMNFFKEYNQPATLFAHTVSADNFTATLRVENTNTVWADFGQQSQVSVTNAGNVQLNATNLVAGNIVTAYVWNTNGTYSTMTYGAPPGVTMVWPSGVTNAYVTNMVMINWTCLNTNLVVILATGK
jgi:hypothetical protein